MTSPPRVSVPVPVSTVPLVMVSEPILSELPLSSNRPELLMVTAAAEKICWPLEARVMVVEGVSVLLATTIMSSSTLLFVKVMV